MSWNNNHGGLILPPRWLNCPRRSQIIADKFIAIKTPLDERYSALLQPGQLWTPHHAIKCLRDNEIDVGLWIDLSFTNRFYDFNLVSNDKVGYIKIQCRGHGECPDENQTQSFNEACRSFIRKYPSKKIVVHCTHGFNRTGYLICSFLVIEYSWSVYASFQEFTRCRPPGIYKPDYITQLFKRFGDESETPDPPQLPRWCLEDRDPSFDRNQQRNNKKKIPTFMEGINGVILCDEKTTHDVIEKCKGLSHSPLRGFPGSQPVSMSKENICLLARHPYYVSWKADGTRYMMFIDGPDSVFLIDRDDAVFKTPYMRFPYRKTLEQNLNRTLLDGEMIVDEVQGVKSPRFLIYDIVSLLGANVGKENFVKRMRIIEVDIIEPRELAKEQGLIDRAKEIFGVRLKTFYPLDMTSALFSSKFTSQLPHEIDGLVFQPVEGPYHPGRCDRLLKWKPESLNSVDFKLLLGQAPDGYGTLVCGQNCNYGQIRLTPELSKLDGQIIECTYDVEKSEWKFMRVRTDKSYPNAVGTVDSVFKTIKDPITKDTLLDYIYNRALKSSAAVKRPANDAGHCSMQPPKRAPQR